MCPTCVATDDKEMCSYIEYLGCYNSYVRYIDHKTNQTCLFQTVDTGFSEEEVREYTKHYPIGDTRQLLRRKNSHECNSPYEGKDSWLLGIGILHLVAVVLFFVAVYSSVGRMASESRRTQV